MVYQTAQAVNIPIIGMGGVMSAEDAIELMMAGATAVSVGTANFTDPAVMGKIVHGLQEYMTRYAIEDVRSLIKTAHNF
jgi:dihydroorotate dehydrogenase (NAD+) catalytic subunit